MLTEKENERLCQVGPGTPMGELLRRYWHPVATVSDLEREHVLGLRRLGEDLVLYRTRTGGMGLIQQRCAHRAVSLAYGIPTEDGLRCEYHGWVYDAEGRCLEQPFEEMEHQNANFKDKIHVTAYPVEELGGLIFAYMGPPEKKPLLPRWETFVQPGVSLSIGLTDLPCNWMQCMENSMDPVHFEWLHANQTNWQREKKGLPPANFPAQHQKIDFDIFDYGIYKRRLLVGDDPATSPDWQLGHPVLFPNTLALSGREGFSFQIRVPIDDAHTWQVRYATSIPKPGEGPVSRVFEVPYEDENGNLIVEGVTNQDLMAWITQGRTLFTKPGIAPRHLEHLGVSDRGIIMYRNLMLAAADAVERGEDPPGLVYDTAKNEPMIKFHGEAEMGDARAAFAIARRGS
jgi:5,5'-dehydrodivanillate O-demethylase